VRVYIFHLIYNSHSLSSPILNFTNMSKQYKIIYANARSIKAEIWICYLIILIINPVKTFDDELPFRIVDIDGPAIHASSTWPVSVLIGNEKLDLNTNIEISKFMETQLSSLSTMKQICDKISKLNVSTSCPSTIPQLSQEFTCLNKYVTKISTPIKTRSKRSFEWLYRVLGLEDEYTTSLMVRKAANTFNKVAHDIESRNQDLNKNINSLIIEINKNENALNSEITKSILTTNFLQTEISISNNLHLLKSLLYEDELNIISNFLEFFDNNSTNTLKKITYNKKIKKSINIDVA
jgi:hypothetical protein